MTYNSVGSGTGKKEFGSGLNDFAGTDSTVKDGDGPAAGSFYYIPTVAAPITVSYNLSRRRQAPAEPGHAGQDLPAATIKTGTTRRSPPTTRARRCRTRTSPSCTARTARARRTTSPSTSSRPAGRRGSSAAATRSRGRPTPRAARRTRGVAQLIKQSDGADRLRRLRRRQGQRPEVRRDQEQGRPVRGGLARRRDRGAGRGDGQGRPDLRPAQRGRRRRPTRSPRRPTCWSRRPTTTPPRPSSSRASSSGC